MKYQAYVKMTLYHKKGDNSTVEITGSDPMHVAHIANTIKRTFGVTGEEITRRVEEIIKTENFRSDESEKRWYDFLRDFFKLGGKRHEI